MRASLNTPYTVASGIEITGSKPYLNTGLNRQQRRMKTPRFKGNGKNYPLTVTGTLKYLRFIQYVFDKAGNTIKTIHHYIAK